MSVTSICIQYTAEVRKKFNYVYGIIINMNSFQLTLLAYEDTIFA